MTLGVNERIASLARRARRRHRAANLVFVFAGLGFGSALYLARTRFAQLWRGGGVLGWVLLVAVATVVFAGGARLHSGATRLDEEARELVEKLRAEEQERLAADRARRRSERDGTEGAD